MTKSNCVTRRKYCDAASRLSASVVICAYTEARWQLLVAAVSSVALQSPSPHEIIICVDHNHSLYLRCLAEWTHSAVSDVPIFVVENKYAGRLGSARNTASELATGEILAFIDDDAYACHGWLEQLLAAYCNQEVGAVGGRPSPIFQTPRPAWFPLQFDWIFGCAYDGLPTVASPLLRLIGANMSVRRTLLLELGGFHSDNHDDMDLCQRIVRLWGTQAVRYEPSAVVAHYVPTQRTSWAYFWRRCFHVNRGKVIAFAKMGAAASMRAEAGFVKHALLTALPHELRQAVGGDLNGISRAVAILLGISLAAAGHIVGRIGAIWNRVELVETFDVATSKENEVIGKRA